MLLCAGGHCCSQNNSLIRATLKIPRHMLCCEIFSLIKMVPNRLELNHLVFCSLPFMVCQSPLLALPPGNANTNKSGCSSWKHVCLLPKAKNVQNTKFGACCIARPFYSRIRAAFSTSLRVGLNPSTLSNRIIQFFLQQYVVKKTKQKLLLLLLDQASYPSMFYLCWSQVNSRPTS